MLGIVLIAIWCSITVSYCVLHFLALTLDRPVWEGFTSVLEEAVHLLEMFIDLGGIASRVMEILITFF